MASSQNLPESSAREMDLEALSGVVRRDMQQVLRYRDFCRAQEALLQSKMQLSAGDTPIDRVCFLGLFDLAMFRQNL